MMNDQKLYDESGFDIIELDFDVSAFQNEKSDRADKEIDNIIKQVDKITGLLPGMKRPTVMTMADKSWDSIQTVIETDEFWNVIDLLKENGAQGILICPIDKMFV